MRRFVIIGFAAAALTVAAASSARAGIRFELGNRRQPNEQNILFNTDQTGSLIKGFTNTSGAEVNFTSGGHQRPDSPERIGEISIKCWDLPEFLDSGTGTLDGKTRQPVHAS